jgi:hypothetical protein
MGTLRLADVEQALDRRLKETEEFISVWHHRANVPGARFTTPEMIEMERRTIETVRQGIGQHQPLGRTLNKEEFDTTYRERLNDGQKEMVWNVLQSRYQVLGVQGGAGTGKTTALQPLRELAEAAGYETRGLAPHPAPLNPSMMRVSNPKHSRRISCGRRSIRKIGLVCTFWMNPVFPPRNKLMSFFPASVATTALS